MAADAENLMPSSEEVLGRAAAWQDSGKAVAIATVVNTWGSSPRPVGSQLAVSGAQEMIGSVSGGCIEGAVVAEAQEVIRSGAPRLLESASPTRTPGPSALPAAAGSKCSSNGWIRWTGH